MPIYEYRCRACGQAFEKLVYGSAPRPDVGCPGCESRDVTRTLSLFGVKPGSRVMTAGGPPAAGGSGGACCGGGCSCR